MPGLKEIAQASGVSIRTVSRVLTDNGYVSAATRQAVRSAAERLGYRPNRFARSLKTQKSYEIAVVATSYDELHMAKIAGFESTLRQADYSVTILFDHTDSRQQFCDGIIDELAARQVAAAAIFTSNDENTLRWAKRLEDHQTPYVFFSSEPSQLADNVAIGRGKGIYDAVMHLAQTGRRRIAYVGPATAASRTEGYLQAMAELGREPIQIAPPGGDEHTASDYQKTARNFRSIDNMPDAVQLYSDEMAMGFLAGLHEAHIKIPDEVAVVGFDDRSMAALCWPPLTTVAQPNWDAGKAAAEIIIAKLSDAAPPADGWSRIIPSKLVVRESS